MKRETIMRKMRDEGATYREIGEAFGISRQRVYHIIGGGAPKKYYRQISSDKCKYPVLLCWLNNHNVSIAEISRKMYGNANANNISSISRCISGKSDIRKSHIDKLINITGLSYETLFSEE